MKQQSFFYGYSIYFIKKSKLLHLSNKKSKIFKLREAKDEILVGIVFYGSWS